MTDLGRPRPDIKTQLDRAADRIAAAVPIARAIVDGRKAMSVIDKLDLVVTRRLEHDKLLSDGADKLLERYAESGVKAERAFDKHHARLDAEDASVEATDDAIERMSNATGNSDGSGQSSEPQKNTNGSADKVDGA